MALLVATPKAATANSYLTVAQADALLLRRLYASAWTDAVATPDGEGFLVNAGAGVAAGQTSVPVDGGSGTLTSGCKIQFAGHSTIYTLGAALATASGTLTVSPALTTGVADNEAITRVTASERESSLLWATSLLDSMMEWRGTPTEPTIQALRWPRYGVYNRDGTIYLDQDVIPAEIAQATAELALALLGRDRVAMPDLLGQGIQEASVGSLRVVVSKQQVEDSIPDHIYAIVAHLGSPLQQATRGGTKTLRLERA